MDKFNKLEILISKTSSVSDSADSFEIQDGGINDDAKKVIKVINKVINNSEDHNELFPDHNLLFPEISVANNVTLDNSSSSFTSINSSLFGSFESNITDNVESNLDMRNLLGHILVKLEQLDEQLNIQKDKNEKLEEQLNVNKDKNEKLRNDNIHKFKKLQKLNDSLNHEIDYIYDELFSLDCRIIHVEQYSRRECLVISGIPDYIPQSNLESTVLNIINKMGLKNVSSFEVTACHRLYKDYNDKFPARTIIKFTNRKIVEWCLFHRDRIFEVSNQLRMNLRIFESLCQTNEKIIKQCVQLLKYGHIKEYYITNGTIRIIKNDKVKPIKIQHPDYLYDLFKFEFECNDLYML